MMHEHDLRLSVDKLKPRHYKRYSAFGWSLPSYDAGLAHALAKMRGLSEMCMGLAFIPCMDFRMMHLWIDMC